MKRETLNGWGRVLIAIGAAGTFAGETLSYYANMRMTNLTIQAENMFESMVTKGLDLVGKKNAENSACKNQPSISFEDNYFSPLDYQISNEFTACLNARTDRIGLDIALDMEAEAYSIKVIQNTGANRELVKLMDAGKDLSIYGIGTLLTGSFLATATRKRKHSGVEDLLDDAIVK